MKLKGSLIILIYLLLSLAQAQTPVTLKIGALNYPPYFEISGTGQAKGIGVEVIESLYSPDFKLFWVDVPLNRGMMAIEQGHIDIYTAYTNDLKKYPKLQFATSPYLTLSPQLCGKGEINFSESYSELDGKTIVAPAPSKMIDRISTHKAKIMRVSYGQDYVAKSTKLIALKRADYFFAPTDHFVADFLKSNPDFKCGPFGPSYRAYLSAKKEGAFAKHLKEVPMRQAKNTP